MTYDGPGQTALDYYPCRYGASKLLFRGPKRKLEGDYVAYLGGIETYGKFIEVPYPALIEQETGIKSVNLGCVNAGVDAYIGDKHLVEICDKARVTVIEITGAPNISNRFYAVHPRRNDRFLRASSLLSTIYREIDFTEFNFTRHLLSSLAEVSPEKFVMVEKELRDAWVARMTSLIQQIGGKVVLLWLSDHSPDDPSPGFDAETTPMLVDRRMLDAVTCRASQVVEIVAAPDEVDAGLHEMLFGPLEQPAAEEVIGPVVHRRAAAALAPVIQALA